jgi:hypothetical protein
MNKGGRGPENRTKVFDIGHPLRFDSIIVKKKKKIWTEKFQKKYCRKRSAYDC